MSAASILSIIRIIVAAVEAALSVGKSINEALADSFEEAAAKLRDGRLRVDDAVDRARDDQAPIDALRNRGGGG